MVYYTKMKLVDVGREYKFYLGDIIDEYNGKELIKEDLAKYKGNLGLFKVRVFEPDGGELISDSEIKEKVLEYVWCQIKFGEDFLSGTDSLCISDSWGNLVDENGYVSYDLCEEWVGCGMRMGNPGRGIFIEGKLFRDLKVIVDSKKG